MISGDKKTQEECILIVEDNPINQALIQRELKKQGFDSLMLANNGKEAIDITLEHKPDLVLMDIQLPDMNGNIVVQKLREKSYKRPIIAISADTSKEDINKSLNVGVNEYIFKPIDFNQLFSIMKKYLKKAEPKEISMISGKQTDDEKIKKKFKIPDSISKEVLNIFFTDAEEKLNILEEVLKNDLFEIEIDKIKAIAHEYKGTASYFNLINLERTAIELDEAFKRPDSIPQLKLISRKLMEILKEIVNSDR